MSNYLPLSFNRHPLFIDSSLSFLIPWSSSLLISLTKIFQMSFGNLSPISPPSFPLTELSGFHPNTHTHTHTPHNHNAALTITRDCWVFEVNNDGGKGSLYRRADQRHPLVSPDREWMDKCLQKIFILTIDAFQNSWMQLMFYWLVC